MIALIEVKNLKRQIVNVSSKNTSQEIVIVNKPFQSIDIKQNNFQNIHVNNKPTQKVDVEQDVVIVRVYKDVHIYEGEYEVTPKFAEQSLPTKEKLLEKDVKVKEIPYTEVSNNSGGLTVIIG